MRQPIQPSLFSQITYNDIPYRYGLEDIPPDITKQELLAFFSFDDKDSTFIREKCRFYHYRVALGIQIGAHRFIGRAQPHQEPPPAVVIRFIARALRLKGNFVPLKLSERLKTYQVHSQLAREYLGLSSFPVTKRQNLIDYLICEPPDPGHLPQWIKKVEDYLRKNNYVLPSLKELRRLVLSARHQSIEQVMHQIKLQLGNKRKELFEKLLLTGETGISRWTELTNKNIYKATAEKLSEVLKRIKKVRELSLKDLDLSQLPQQHIYFLPSREFKRLRNN